MHSASEMRIRVLAAILPISPDRSRRFIVCRLTPDKSESSRAVMPRFMRHRSNDAKMDRLLIRMPKGQKDTIKEYAEKNGKSVNGFINRLIAEALEK